MLSIYPSKLSPLSNEVFFTAGTLHWINGSSLESIKLSQNAPGIYDMSDVLLFLVILIFSVTLFSGDFDSSSFSCSNVIVLLIIQEEPFRGVLEKKCSENMRHGCSPVNLLQIFRTAFLKVGLSPSMIALFASMIALQKWWKMLFISS